MADFLRDCNSGELKTDPKTFQDTWCTRCQRVDCDLAKYAKTDPMAYRQATWKERFFGLPQVDGSVPKFAQIARLDFPNLLQKAMKLEISERRGDWSVPDVPEVPILDGRIETAQRDTTTHVDDAIRKLAQASGRSAPPLPEDTEETFPAVEESAAAGSQDRVPVKSAPPQDDVAEMSPEIGGMPPIQGPPPAHPKSQQPFQPSARNVPDRGEVMLGGAPAPTKRAAPSEEQDPWAPPPKPTVRVVKPGARIQFGGGGTVKVSDE